MLHYFIKKNYKPFRKSENSYGDILKSSSIMGVVAVIALILGMIRVKFAAIIIGTAGVGLVASFTALQGLFGAIAGLGIQSSAVREVAAAYAMGDDLVVGETVLTLRRISWITGLLGAISMLLASPLLSQLNFSSNEYQWHIAALGLIILFTNLSGGQTAHLQGARRIADMARVQIVSAIAGTVLTVSLYLWQGIAGIIPALVLTAAVQLLTSWYFAKRLPISKVEMTWCQSLNKARDIAKLGFVMMWTGFMSSGVAYATTALIAKKIDVQAVGIYSAAFALSGMFVNFVLNAMSADYYPRLSASASDRETVNKLVNEQTEIGVLLALPGLIATMVLAPWIIQFFYSKEFLPAVGLIQWIILGCLGRVISWPLGFVMLALGKAKLYLATETIAHITHMILIIACVAIWSLEGVGLAFFFLYVLYSAFVLSIGRSLTNFYWSKLSVQLILISGCMLMFSFVLRASSSSFTSAIFGVAMITLSCAVSLVIFARRLDQESRFVQTVFSIPILRNFCKI